MPAEDLPAGRDEVPPCGIMQVVQVVQVMQVVQVVQVVQAAGDCRTARLQDRKTKIDFVVITFFDTFVIIKEKLWHGSRE